MKVYKCLITGDEMFTDAFPMREEDGFYILKGKLITVKAGDVDDALLGANPSAEECGEGTEEETETGVDVVLNNRLKPTGFSKKKDYQAYMKEYIKAVLKKLEESGMAAEDVEKAKAEAGKAFKTACAKYSDLQFFYGESENPDGLIALVEWVEETNDEGNTECVPYTYFYQIGLEAEKC